MIGMMMVLFISFSRVMSMVLVLYRFKDEIMLHCFREVESQQSYTPGI